MLVGDPRFEATVRGLEMLALAIVSLAPHEGISIDLGILD